LFGASANYHETAQYERADVISTLTASVALKNESTVLLILIDNATAVWMLKRSSFFAHVLQHPE
jgi:hypothetical protein